MKRRVVPVIALAVTGWLAAVLARPASLVLTPTPESEPNNTPATAAPLNLVSGCQAASGAISPVGDVDYYSFTASAGSKVWAEVDTSGDSVLTLFGPDGTTVLETDDDDGIGNNCDATIESLFASAIAGRTLTAGGTYFLRVQSFGDASTISAYKLLVTVTTGSTTESEPNDTAATANTIATSGAPIGVRNGNITTPTDVDVYSVFAPAGSTLFISGDGDPERNGVGTDIVLDLLAPDGTTVLLSVDNSDNVGIPAPPAESFCFNITTTGTYFVRVRGFQSIKITTTGTYALMVAVCGLPAGATPTPTRTLTPTVTATPGGPTATPTSSPTPGPPTATPTVTSTPIGGIVPSNIPTLSFPMLLLMGLCLVISAFLLVRRL